jgi:hypothetical protein
MVGPTVGSGVGTTVILPVTRTGRRTGDAPVDSVPVPVIRYVVAVLVVTRVSVKFQLMPASALETAADPDPPVDEKRMWPASLQVTTIGLVAGPMVHAVEWNCSPIVGSPGPEMALK